MASMRRKSRTVKRKRTYDVSLRREQANQNHARIIERAERRFLRDGYAKTTIALIAKDAGVSVDTIYKSFGGKPGLIHAIRARVLLGTRPTPAEQRSDEIQALQPDPREIIRRWGEFVMEIAPIAAPILLLVRDAAGTHPELRRLLEEMDEDRLRRMTDNARRFAAAGHLRPGITTADAADVLWTYSSIELYELLVLRRSMPLKTYGRFVAEAMIAALV
jgi:AcrR family transcriptional regulator